MRRLAARRAGRLVLALSWLVLALGGVRFEFHAHSVPSAQDGHTHSHVAHSLTGDQGHELGMDLEDAATMIDQDRGQSSLHAHELGALAALPGAHMLPQLGVPPKTRLALPDTAAVNVLLSAPPIRPPII
jgi:hypothetical protein